MTTEVEGRGRGRGGRDGDNRGRGRGGRDGDNRTGAGMSVPAGNVQSPRPSQGPRLRPARTHRQAALKALPAIQHPLAEEVLKGGVPGVRPGRSIA